MGRVLLGATRSRPAGLLWGLALLAFAAALAAPPAARAGADVTFDLHFRVYCDLPTGANLCFPTSGWKTCPLVSGTTGCQSVGGICPPPWAVLCAGAGCLPSFELVVISLLDPSEELHFDFQIAGGALIVAPLPGRSAEETVDALRGGLFTGVRGAPPDMRMEIRSHDTRATEAVVLADYQAGRRQPGPGRHHDGFGNACDLDVDQDGVVSTAERQLVDDCTGVDLADPVSVPADGEGEDVEVPRATLEMLGLQARCTPADLDGDGLVDDNDARRADALLGLPPGPSGLTVIPEPAGQALVALLALAALAARRGGKRCGIACCSVSAAS